MSNLKNDQIVVEHCTKSLKEQYPELEVAHFNSIKDEGDSYHVAVLFTDESLGDEIVPK
ncbi:hypothetical protein HSE3_gp002 [Bacillus phage vB_BceM-HSE3]|nr:hypothetical protein HSE3_gp002 [Bacillus phage vB_BceM-HSE3]